MLNRLSKIGSIIQDEKGVSLIEVILILVILGISIIPLSRLAITNLETGGRYAITTRAMYHAEELLEHVIADYAADAAGRGYDWVILNWSGQTSPNPPEGLTGTVTISAEDSLNGVTYVVVQATVSGPTVEDVTLTTWLIDNN